MYKKIFAKISSRFLLVHHIFLIIFFITGYSKSNYKRDHRELLITDILKYTHAWALEM